LSYPGTDVAVILFSVISPSSFNNVVGKWAAEIKHHCPGVPIILVGTKIDLRDDPASIRKLDSKGYSAVTTAEGEEKALEIDAVAYHEISSLTNVGLDDLFKNIIRIPLTPSSGGEKGSRKRGNCLMM
jgi:small GTP-binding protein